MAYVAAKPCRFDKQYFIGDVVPDEVIDPARAAHLVEIGILHRAPKGRKSKQDTDPSGGEGDNPEADRAPGEKEAG